MANRLKLGILETDIELLENEIDSMENNYNDSFVLPGGHTTVTLSYCTMRCRVQSACSAFKAIMNQLEIAINT
jgi:cob(I)alamin adenosyltransferase